MAFRRSAFALRGVFLACGSKIVNPEKNQGWIKLKKINSTKKKWGQKRIHLKKMGPKCK